MCQLAKARARIMEAQFQRELISLMQVIEGTVCRDKKNLKALVANLNQFAATFGYAVTMTKVEKT
jgi:hypothetical protein